MLTQYEIGVIGAGNAAEGIVHAILRNTILFSDRIIASDPSEARRKLFAEKFHISVTPDNRQLVENSGILIFAVKPQQYVGMCEGIADLVQESQLIVSIMAGVSTKSVEKMFSGRNIRVVRAMPNLPIHVGAGMTGVCGGTHAQPVDVLRAQRIFDAGGRSVVIEDEAQMDAITAVSGSGPAYFYYFVEALTAAGERVGLTRQMSEILAKQVCLGAARMMLENGDPPHVLRAKVTSPGGTTQAAIESMTRDKVLEHIGDGVVAACKRGQELGR